MAGPEAREVGGAKGSGQVRAVGEARRLGQARAAGSPWVWAAVLVLVASLGARAEPAGSGPAGNAVLDPDLRAAIAAASRERGIDLFDDRCGACLLARWEVCDSRGANPEAVLTARRAIAGQGSAEVLAAGYNRLGVSLFKMGDLPVAAEAWRKAIELNGPEAGAVRANLGLVEFRQGRYGEAVTAARAALALPPGGPRLVHPRVVLCRARQLGGGAVAPADGGPDASVLKVEGEVQRPRKISSTPPVYTPEARKAKVRGIVILESIIDREGCVQDLHVLKGLDHGLDRAAVDAVRRWVFEPATKEGTPVAVYYTVTVSFDVQGGRKPPAAGSP
jgi:TonB family protein